MAPPTDMPNEELDPRTLRTGDATSSPPNPRAGSSGVGPRAEARARIEALIGAIRDQAAFETATLFMPTSGAERWALTGRVGPVRPWHAALDPQLVTALEDGGVYPSARSIPGVGLRLAGLGCGSVAVLTVPGGSRVVLDSAFPKSEDAPVPTDDGLIASLAEATGELTFAGSGERTADELLRVERLLDDARRVIEVPGSTIPQLLRVIRNEFGAAGVVLLKIEDGRWTVEAPTDDDRSYVITAPVAAILRNLPPSGHVPAEIAERLGVGLGLPASTVRAATSGGQGDVLLAAWEGDPRVAPDAVSVAARVVGAVGSALHLRDVAIEAHIAPERARWAHDIHDGLTQTVTAAVIQLENLRGMIRTDPDAAEEALGRSQEEIRRSLGDLRSTMSDLAETGAAPNPTKPLEALIEDVVRRWRLPARISVEGNVAETPEPIRSVALVVVREALTNAAKHAAAKNVSVRVHANPEGLTVVVKDNGRGFDPSQAEQERGRLHLGMGLMRQRVADVGGSLHVTSAPGVGTKVIAFVPIPESLGTE